MLDYEFKYQPLDLDEQSIEAPMRLSDESEEAFDHRVVLYQKEQELNHARRQWRTLDAVTRAINQTWEGGLLPVRPGLEKVSKLQAELADVGRTVAHLESELADAQKEFKDCINRQIDLARERTLQQEYDKISDELANASGDQVLVLHTRFSEIKKALSAVTARNAAAAALEQAASRAAKRVKLGSEADKDVPYRTVYLRMTDEEKVKMTGASSRFHIEIIAS